MRGRPRRLRTIVPLSLLICAWRADMTRAATVVVHRLVLESAAPLPELLRIKIPDQFSRPHDAIDPNSPVYLVDSTCTSVPGRSLRGRSV